MTTLKLTLVELKLFLREPIAVVFAFAFPLLVLFVLSGVFGSDLPDNPEDERVWRGVAPTQYYLPAYVGLVVAALGLIVLPVRMAGYREQGVLRRFRAAGIPLMALLSSQVLVLAVMALVGAATVTIMSLAVYGTDLPDDWLGVLAAFALSILAFSAFGFMLGGVLGTVRAAQGAGLALFFVMMFLSGAGPPREVMTSVMQGVGDTLPLTYVVIALQDPWLGYGWAWGDLAVVTAFLAAALAITAWRFRWQ